MIEDEDISFKDICLVVSASKNGVICKISNPNSYGPGHFGLMLADCIRHVARAFKFPETEVYGWVRREMERPSTTIEGAPVQ